MISQDDDFFREEPVGAVLNDEQILTRSDCTAIVSKFKPGFVCKFCLIQRLTENVGQFYADGLMKRLRSDRDPVACGIWKNIKTTFSTCRISLFN